MDSLLIGILGAWISFYHSRFWSRYKTVAFIASILLFAAARLLPLYVVSPTGLYNCVFSTVTVALATFLVLPALSSYQLRKGIFYKSVTVISLVSYSMYVLHLSLIREWIVKKINWENLGLSSPLNWIAPYILYWGLIIFLSILLYKYFEAPILKRRDRIKL
jgi:peptidoglycan/LPS O-acetylase OafA/YrhL